MKPNSTGSPGTTVSTRLLMLVLIPLTAVCLVAGSVVVEHGSAAVAARELEQDVAGLMELVALRDALQVQHTATSFTLRAEDLGTTTSVISTYFGFDITGPTASARARAQVAVGALGGSSPVSSAALTDLYRDIDLGGPDARLTLDRLSRHLDKSENAIANELHRLLDRLLETNLDMRDVTHALESLRVTNQLVRVAARQGVELSAVWFPTPESRSEGAPLPQAALAADSATFEADLGRLRQVAQPSISTRVDTLQRNAQIRIFTSAVSETLAGRPYEVTSDAAATGGEVPSSVIATFAGYIARGDLLTLLVSAAAADVKAEAAALAATESAALLAWAGLFASICLGTIVMGLRTAHSIAGPLRDLGRYAQAVNRGELNVEPSPRSRQGPREVRVAYSIFHDLVLNLRLLESKAIALAACRFEDPVLGLPFPGRLGTSFESSVAVLAGSIVERDALQSDLTFQSSHDALTGIRNRAAALSGLRAAIERSKRQGSPLAVLFLDLNEFKSVNDRFGHSTGDAVLCEIADRVGRGLRSVDFVARLGGDEFVIVAEGVAGIDGAVALAHRVVDAIGEAIVVGGHRVHVGVAVGIALRSPDTVDPLVLLSQADAAMYRAKRHERSGVEVFDTTLREEALERAAVVRALTHALGDPKGGGLCLHYQPVLEGATGALAGVEALIRWDRAGEGLVAPDSFIPIAEATDLIIDVDRWVIEQAARQLVAWSIDPGLEGLPIAVNVSGRHLLSGLLPGHLHDVITRYGIDPSLLSVEITETVLLTDLPGAGEQLDAVHALGVRVAIDDFGTGYTSPAQLEFLPMDTIKIERSFVSRVQESRGRSLVRMIIDLGHAIDVAIVAEGVETAGELATLVDLGADYVQGFLLSRPIPADEVPAFAAARTGSSSDRRTMVPVSA